MAHIEALLERIFTSDGQNDVEDEEQDSCSDEEGDSDEVFEDDEFTSAPDLDPTFPFLEFTNFNIYPQSPINFRQHLLLILAYLVRHNLNMEQMKDMLKLIKHHCPEKSYCIDNADEIMDMIMTDLQTVFFDQCEICSRIFPEDPSIHKCSSPHCNG